MSTSRTVLVVDDEPSMLRYTRTLLELNKLMVETASSGAEALARIEGGLNPDLVLLDVSMPSMNGLMVLESLRKLRPHQPVAMMSCKTDTSTVVQAIRMGAFDYLPKPFYKAQLDDILKRGMAKQENEVPKQARMPLEPNSPATVDNMSQGFFLAANERMLQVREQAKRIADVDVPVLILGESGVGKEVLARFIFENSSRRSRPWMKVNCAAVPNELLESELFGYEAGAFTGAQRAKPGKFETCHRGTMLLDEIGEMSNALQSKLLQVLQDGEFCRLGGRANQRADVRVIAATNIDIDQAIATRQFREDLYYRLNAFTIKIPPLRERRSEIPLLLKHYMSFYCDGLGVEPFGYSNDFLNVCMSYSWPGNIRELSNVVKKLAILRDEGLVTQDLRHRPSEMIAASMAASRGDLKVMVRDLKDQAELQAVHAALREHNWNRRRTATHLNISYKALLYKIKQYRLKPDLPRAAGVMNLAGMAAPAPPGAVKPMGAFSKAAGTA
jgi:two-component system, NtrC family, response regulator AtoC